MSGVDLKWRPFSAILIVGTLFLSAAAGDRKESADPSLKQLDAIARSYKIEIVTADPQFPVKTAHGKIDGRKADSKSLETYSGLFASEFSLYPPDLVKRTKLKSVVLCANLSFAGQLRNAIPDFENDVLYLDVSRGTHSKTYLRSVIHHEFFHIIDFRDDGLLYEDERWDALRPPKFKYGSGGRNAQDIRTTSVLTDKFPGFLNHYSTTGIEEDKAEFFAYMIVDPAYVEERARKNAVMTAKMERMKELTASFCPDLNDEFWEKVGKMKRPRD